MARSATVGERAGRCARRVAATVSIGSRDEVVHEDVGEARLADAACGTRARVARPRTRARAARGRARAGRRRRSGCARTIEMSLQTDAQHLRRVAVRPDDARVRVDGDERVEVAEVGRALQVPARRRAAPLEELQHALVVAVGRHHVAAEPPADVARARAPCPRSAACGSAGPSRSMFSVGLVVGVVVHAPEVGMRCCSGARARRPRRCAGRSCRSRARAAASAAATPTSAASACRDRRRGGARGRWCRCAGGR